MFSKDPLRDDVYVSKRCSAANNLILSGPAIVLPVSLIIIIHFALNHHIYVHL
jgi:hypothetical protein